MKKAREKATRKYEEKEATPLIVEEPGEAYLTLPAAHTVAMLGMQKNAQFRSVSSDNDFIELIREGVPKEAMNNLMHKTGITNTEMASITHTSDRTLRRYESGDRLPQEQSERVIELARLYSRGSEVLGGLDYFKDWMSTKLIPLGDKRPKEFLDTSLGIDLLMKTLGRIEHGVFA
ncbi:type II RES/Xre toxin-antitoxin system antitoxin [Taibaiella koreensis]|uniref:type II RES/Xre toxin-antitoxin system antitoxin n=1 Tax=Taibaiella koreensis TaxID=1268548 RepID=UPI0013C2F52D|nr:antitoxin Xre-like helix-turn-helix domain-containing protein [Taibaiella koreensis]